GQKPEVAGVGSSRGELRQRVELGHARIMGVRRFFGYGPVTRGRSLGRAESLKWRARSEETSMSFDLVLFGGTGDLAWRKLMPALFQAFRHGTLPADGRIIGIARDSLSDEQYRELIRSRFEQVDLAKRPSAQEFDRFAAMLHY